MKKILQSLLLITLVVSITALIIGCNKVDHTHVWSTVWQCDDTHHWHACMDPKCSEKEDYGLHNFILDHYKVGQEPTLSSSGVGIFLCEICLHDKEMQVPKLVPLFDNVNAFLEAINDDFWNLNFTVDIKRADGASELTGYSHFEIDKEFIRFKYLDFDLEGFYIFPQAKLGGYYWNEYYTFFGGWFYDTMATFWNSSDQALYHLEYYDDCYIPNASKCLFIGDNFTFTWTDIDLLTKFEITITDANVILTSKIYLDSLLTDLGSTTQFTFTNFGSTSVNSTTVLSKVEHTSTMFGLLPIEYGSSGWLGEEHWMLYKGPDIIDELTVVLTDLGWTLDSTGVGSGAPFPWMEYDCSYIFYYPVHQECFVGFNSLVDGFHEVIFIGPNHPRMSFGILSDYWSNSSPHFELRWYDVNHYDYIYNYLLNLGYVVLCEDFDPSHGYMGQITHAYYYAGDMWEIYGYPGDGSEFHAFFVFPSSMRLFFWIEPDAYVFIFGDGNYWQFYFDACGTVHDWLTYCGYIIVDAETIASGSSEMTTVTMSVDLETCVVTLQTAVNLTTYYYVRIHLL